MSRRQENGMIFLSAADTEAVFEWSSAIGCIRDAYACDIAAAALPGRLVAADRSAWIRCMPAIPLSGRYMGVKQISRTRNGKVIYVITLFDKDTGEISHLIDGISITALRTASTSAVALDELSGPGPVDLAVLGSGLEARTHVKAVSHIRELKTIAIFSPTQENRERFAAELRETLRADIRAASSPEAAVRGASHVIAAARSRDESPILLGSWLNAGAVVISVGSTTRSQREIDVSVVKRADIIVADVPDELATDTGDMIAATAAGVQFDHKLFSLQELVQKRIPIKESRDGIRMFKSVGSALQDVSFAEYIASAAATIGLGSALKLDFQIKQSIGKNT
jgi:ornithine cyclodeaminase/alanine dehydrogenase-like protein (mu-crystallin family)